MDLDLDISHYTINDLEIFFSLKGNYTQDDIEAKEYKIREQLLSSGHIDKRFKRDLIEFLDTAKYWIATVKFPKKDPTSIPKNYKLDPLDTPLSRTLPSSRAINVIDRPPTQFVHAKTEEFFQGVLNPLETRVITRCVNIDTRFRENLYATKSSDFAFQLPFKLSKVVSMQLASIELPITFYGVSAAYGNNYFWIQLEQAQLINNVTTRTIHNKLIQIADGNYNASDLVAAINTSMYINTDILQQDIFQAIEFVLDITQSGSGTGKVSLQLVPTAPQVETVTQVMLDFQKDLAGNMAANIELSTKLGWNLGFLRPIYEGAIKYTADTIIEPATVRYLFLAIDDYHNSGNNHFMSAFQKSVLNPNILARISVKGTYFSLVMENDLNIVSEPRRYFGPVDIQRLRIRLFDEYGRIVDMNNANFSFCLNFKLMYDL
jgi:hypothetical protein